MKLALCRDFFSLVWFAKEVFHAWMKKCWNAGMEREKRQQGNDSCKDSLLENKTPGHPISDIAKRNYQKIGFFLKCFLKSLLVPFADRNWRNSHYRGS